MDMVISWKYLALKMSILVGKNYKYFIRTMESIHIIVLVSFKDSKCGFGRDIEKSL